MTPEDERIEYINQLAFKNAFMPDNLSSPERGLFLKLRAMYIAYRAEMKSATDKAKTIGKYKREKELILQDYGCDRLSEEIYQRVIKLYHDPIMIEAIKSDCPRCRKLAAKIDGRER